MTAATHPGDCPAPAGSAGVLVNALAIETFLVSIMALLRRWLQNIPAYSQLP
jgi:hypothetical protein